MNLNGAPSGRLSVRDAGGFIRWGAEGINPNATATENSPDADIFPLNVDNLDGNGGSSAGTSPATLGAQGGAGTGAPLSQGIRLQGNNGIDHLTGGAGNDTLEGFLGTDTIDGGSGDDTLDPGAGDDAMDGGPGSDTADYSGFGIGSVSVDLAIAGPQNTGGSGNDSFTNVENLLGTSNADILSGDGGPNRLTSFNGNDTIDGRGGNDTIDAGDGEDAVTARDGGPDSVNCGAAGDTVTADVLGVDTLTGCESVLFAPGPPGPPGAGGPPPAVADTLAPSFTGRPTASPRSFEVDSKGRRETAVSAAKKGTAFRYSLSEAATVTFGVERATGGRRVGGRCRKRTGANAKGRRCTLFSRVSAFRASAVAGRNSTRFSGRIGRRSLAPGSYRARLTAVDRAGNRSRTVNVSFRILARQGVQALNRIARDFSADNRLK